MPPGLVEDLESIVKLIREYTAASSGEKQPSLALLRVLSGLSIEKWESLADANGLENWLGIPLEGSLAESVSRLASSHAHLAFQRDHDELTGIGNRRLFDRVLKAELDRAKRTQTDISLLMLDLDNFKQINDTYGHSCGDLVLRRLGEILKASVRRYDVPVRFGGEEFAVILPATSCWTAVMLGNRIREQFQNEQFEWKDSVFSMTFSGGAASLSTLEHERRKIDELIKSADDALYDAKRQGKNAISLLECRRLANDRSGLVLSQEKQFLFSSLGSE